MSKGSTRKSQSQVILLYVSTLLGVVLGFVASVVNTRALSPADYGDVRYVQNIIQLIASLLLFGYFLSGSRLLALSDSDRGRAEIRGVMVIILAVSAVILMACVGVAGAFHIDDSHIRYLLWLSLPVCLYPLLVNYINTTAQGDNHIGILSSARVLPALIYIPVAYCFYDYYGATSSRMILLQWGVYSVVLFLLLLLTRPQFANVRSVFVKLNEENKSYGMLLYYGSLAMVFTNYVAGVTLGIFNEDNVEVGYYTLALNLSMPLSYLPGIVGTAFFRQFSRTERIPKKVIKWTLLMTVLTTLAFVVLISPLVSLMYPPEYYSVAWFASIMSVGFAVHGLGDMLNRFLGSHGQGRAILNSSIACGLVKIIGFTLFVYWFDVKGALATNVISSLVYAGCIWYYYKRYTR